MFTANTDAISIVRNNFPRPIIARTIRIYPRGEEFAIYCMRLELYGCKWTHELCKFEIKNSYFYNYINNVFFIKV